jgi:hypothetical protein
MAEYERNVLGLCQDASTMCCPVKIVGQVLVWDAGDATRQLGEEDRRISRLTSRSLFARAR